jgi:hypothetical protein
MAVTPENHICAVGSDDNSFASRAGKIKIVEFFLPGRLGHSLSL